MPSLRTLRNKIKSIKSTQQITRAMKMVATARLSRAQGRILDARPFASKLELLINQISSELGIDNLNLNPLQIANNTNRIAVLLVTSDKGLCGSFNTTLYRQVIDFVNQNKSDELSFFIVGKKGRDFCRRIGLKTENEYVNFFLNLSYVHAENIGTDLINFYTKTHPRFVCAIYQQFKSVIQQQLVLKTLLPLGSFLSTTNHETKNKNVDFLYEPHKELLLSSLLPRYVKAQIYRILLESYAAEQSARMTAMDNATGNATELIEQLTLEVNKVRQATITRELADIVGTSEALS